MIDKTSDLIRGASAGSSLLDAFRAFPTPAIADALDEIGLRRQVMSPRIAPLDPTSRLVGFAATVDVRTSDQIQDGPRYVQELAAVDDLRKDDVLVVSRAEGCYFGELLTTAAMVRGAAGLVHDCYIRDSLEVVRLGFPAFVRGRSPCEPFGRMMVEARGVPIICGDVIVRPGDVVVGDWDGVVVVPFERAAEVASLAGGRICVEDEVRRAVKKGEPLLSVFDRHGVA